MCITIEYICTYIHITPKRSHQHAQNPTYLPSFPCPYPNNFFSFLSFTHEFDARQLILTSNTHIYMCLGLRYTGVEVKVK